jgi:hypothetical protein
MSSQRETVLAAVEALLVATLPGADVGRNRSFSTRIGVGGAVIMTDGDPGEPEVDLSPINYTYQHRIPLMFAAPDRSTLEALFASLRTAVEADRFLGGLCGWLETEAPQTDSLDGSGVEAQAEASAAVVAEYSTPSPL